MIITFKSGKMIVNSHELLIRLNGEQQVSLHAAREAVTLFGGSNVIVANGSETKWSIKLESDQKLYELAQALGCDIA